MRLRLTRAIGLCVLLAPSLAVAQGCGPTRLKVSESITLDAPPKKVWAMIGNFQDMSWDADIVSTTGVGGNEPDKASRTLMLKGGAVLGETLYKYDTGAMSYSFHIDKIDVTRLPVQNVSATLEVVAAADGAKSTVRWKTAFYRYLTAGEGAPDAADRHAVEEMTAYIRSSLAGLKIKIEPRT